VVFGEVLDDGVSMELVKKIEGFGTNSGTTSKQITIKDSGELPVEADEEPEKKDL